MMQRTRRDMYKVIGLFGEALEFETREEAIGKCEYLISKYKTIAIKGYCKEVEPRVFRILV